MKELLFWLLVAAATAFGVSSCLDAVDHSKWMVERKARAEAEQRSRTTPHVVREADGCKVYAFERGGRDHYFTRCPASRTVTEGSWEECHQSGKVRSCEIKTESIDG